jgi:hypothetical protein
MNDTVVGLLITNFAGLIALFITQFFLYLRAQAAVVQAVVATDSAKAAAVKAEIAATQAASGAADQQGSLDRLQESVDKVHGMLNSELAARKAEWEQALATLKAHQAEVLRIAVAAAHQEGIATAMGQAKDPGAP